jgi:hypothetical protein
MVADGGFETNWGGQIRWKAEYRVAYSVAGQEYFVWADSGFREESRAFAQLRIPKPLPSCWVQFNPEKPEVSSADCR